MIGAGFDKHGKSSRMKKKVSESCRTRLSSGDYGEAPRSVRRKDSGFPSESARSNEMQLMSHPHCRLPEISHV
jgi:hypothetical protein